MQDLNEEIRTPVGAKSILVLCCSVLHCVDSCTTVILQYMCACMLNAMCQRVVYTSLLSRWSGIKPLFVYIPQSGVLLRLLLKKEPNIHQFTANCLFRQLLQLVLPGMKEEEKEEEEDQEEEEEEEEEG